MITQRDLVEHLQHRNLAAWSVVERIQDIAVAVATAAAGPAGVSGTAAARPARQRRDQRTRLTVIVHQDVPRGRGSARLDISPFDTSAADLIDQAVALALATVGPAWTSTPPAAPARVDLVDPDLIKRDLGAVALGTLAHLRRPDRVAIAATATAVREKHTVIAGSDFHATWLATALHATATLTAAGRSLTVSRLARRAADLDLDPAVADAATDLALLADAGPPIPGPCTLWLGPEALLHGTAPDPADGPDGPDPAAGATPAPDRAYQLDRLDHDLWHGLWTIFARQADSAVERQGLTRYRRGTDIARGAPQLPEPLSITSDGALDFAALSAPVTDDAVAVRSFPLVDRGIAVGLGLSPREAALRHTDPNGGVRNLVVAPGTWSPGPVAAPATAAAVTPAAVPGPRTLEIRRLRAVTIDPYTAEATLDVALGLEHRPGRSGRSAPVAFTGGCIRLDLIAALARARRSSQLVRRGAYHGPAAILVDGVELMR